MKNLTRSYLIALTIIAFVISASQFLVQKSITENSADSRVINISGRQRMLSQKITKAALAMGNSTEEQVFKRRRKELEQAFKLWTKSHNALLNGDEELEMKVVNNSPEVLALYKQLSPSYLAIKSGVEIILRSNSISATKSAAFSNALNTILANEGQFLPIMNSIVFQYDLEASGRVKTLSRTEYILYAIALLLLVFEGLLIFRPAIRRIRDYTKKLSESIAQQNYLIAQAQSVFDNVSQGIFLLDKAMVIDSFYSRKTEEIFDRNDLAEINFLKLFKKRLMPQDLQALEMFVENLFDPSIREEVVNRLNPVTEVELFSSSEEDIEVKSRFVKISFARIYRGKEIYRVLVTILDETENVLMQKQMEESEARNQRESVQLLAVLKINPKILKEYIGTTTEILRQISQRYEHHDGLNFQDLISFTYSTIHTAKGNASLIGLDLIEGKLHEIEEDLEDMRKKLDISGKDFVKIIYKATEVLSILENMDEMLVKIAAVYRQLATEEKDVSSNELLIKTLSRGVGRLNRELSKNINLEIEENKVVVPDELKVAIKDISIQLIRNSMIHGIEGPDDRMFAGKDAKGRIKISFLIENGQFMLDYMDDGAGLDLEKIRQKAMDLNLLDESQTSLMNQEELQSLIFNEKFSTADAVDEHAGRGQGMEIVRRHVEKLNGNYFLDSKEGKYFKLHIKIPLEAALKATL